MELEATVNKIDQTDKLIMAELSGFQQSLKKKDEIIRECLKLTVGDKNSQSPKQGKTERENRWESVFLSAKIVY